MQLNIMQLKICMCIISATLLIVFTPQIFQSLPVLTNLFTDNINYVLIMFVVVFIMLIDVYIGATLAIIILYMAVYVNRNINITTTHKKNRMIPMQTLPDSIQILPPNTNMINLSSNNLHMQNNKNTGNTENTGNTGNIDNTITDESEFIYDNTKPFPNNNLKPFQPKDYESKQNTNTNVNSNTNSNLNFVQQTINQNDSITQVGQPDRSGYDVTGCRYDMKNSPQNLTQYGPPVSQCSAYDPAKAQKCGTVFYPLNA